MKKLLQNISLFLFTLMFFSCSGLFDTVVPKETISTSEYGVVSGYINNPYAKVVSRSATSKGGSSEKYFYKITGERKESGVLVDSYEGEYSDSKNFTFTVKKGTWIFTVNCYLSDTAENVDSTKPIFTGKTASVQVTDSTTIPNVNLQIVTGASAYANISLQINVEPDSIKSCKVIFRKVGNSTPEAKQFTYDVTSNKVDVLIQDMPAGAYAVTFEFYSGTRSGINVTGSLIYSTTELITVLNGINITEWDGATLTITQEKIDGTQNHKVYVKSGATGSDNGIYMKPFGSVYDAYTYIKNVNDSTTSSSSDKIEYSIILLSDVTESQTIAIEGNSHPLDLTIESEGTNRFNISTSAAYNTKINNSTSVPLHVTFNNVLMHDGTTGCVRYGRDTSQSGNLSILVAGQTYINNIGVADGSTDDNIVVLDSSLQPVYEDASHNIKTTANGNTRVSNFTYIPGTYDATHVVISGLGLADNYEYIAIKPQTVSGVEKKWILCADGKMEIYRPYISRLTTVPASGETVYVKDEDDLVALASLVNYGYYKNKSNATITLSASSVNFDGVIIEQEQTVSLSGKTWKPIGYFSTATGDAAYGFKGVYDGKGNEITDLSVTESTVQTTDTGKPQGLFGKIKDGTVQNLTVSGNISIDPSNPTNTTYLTIGGIAGILDGGKIDNCISNITIGKGRGTNNNGCGGIVGYSISGTVTNSKFTGSIEATVRRFFVGGIIGKVDGGTIYNCINEGNITNITSSSNGTYFNQTGGIIGGVVSNSVNVYNCINKGKIIVRNSDYSSYLGGIIGYSPNYDSKIHNCVNVGELEKHYQSSGIVDLKISSILNVVTTLNKALEVKNCFYKSSGTEKYINIDVSTNTYIQVENNYGFTKNSPVSPWYGTLETAVNDGTYNTKALVYVLNSWVNTSNTASSSQIYKNWYVSASDELEFGTEPADVPPVEVVAESAYLSSLTFIPDAADSAKNTVYVKTHEDLKALADFVNTGTYSGSSIILDETQRTFEGITIIQEDDIDLISYTNWVSIGTYKNSTDIYFKGTYDGNSKQISNLKITATSYVAPGLFGNVEGEIKNVKVSGEISTSVQDSIGGIVYKLLSGSIHDCISSVNLSNTYALGSSSSEGVGGVVGKLNYGSTVYNCINEGSINTNGIGNVGGLIGVIRSYNGASATTVKVYNNINKGEITDTSSGINRNIGGIVGYSPTVVEVTNCINKAAVSGSGKNKGYGAGIIGTIGGTVTKYNILNNVNIGAVSGFQYNYEICANSYYSSGYSGNISNNYYNSSVNSPCLSSSNITQSNNQKFTLSSTDGTLTTAVSGITSLLGVLNNWVNTNNPSNNDKYRMWACDATDGLHFDVPANPPISGHTYASSMASAPSSGDTVYIRGSADLEQISNWSQTDSLAGVEFVMDYDVSLAGVDWTAIGKNVSYPFKGIFDGNGKEITDLSKTVDDDFGFFGRTNNATIKNLKISGEVNVTGNGNYASGFVAYGENTLIEKCISNVTITNTSSGGYLASFIAYVHSNGCEINECYNTGTITANQNNSIIGGIVGKAAKSVTIRNTVNSGEIEYTGSSSSGVKIGGIVGLVDSGTTGAIAVIENCANKGKINITQANASTLYAGGIIGFESTSKVDNKIINCISAGKIIGSSNITKAGIIATPSTVATIKYCYWDNTNTTEWKAGTSAVDTENIVYSMSADSNYYMSQQTILGITYQYVTPFLNKWIELNDTTPSIYKKWILTGAVDEARGQGNPALPIEN